ncbi:MAG: aminodeoxychorismate/anthranilate synthase component II [Oscillospiraceae bacterium]|nr:aminodeoxychorismate/anthranilate synthase component II [Oscillospiraceae bacterium]
MILFVDNYDSFTYNLVHLAGRFRTDLKVVRNDALTAEEVLDLCPSHIILSPGPGYPKNAGICEELIRACYKTIPILGVCLGHQAICETFGAEIARAGQLMHGKKSRIFLQNRDPIFQNLPEEIDAARYHSLIVRAETIPSSLQVLARGPMGEVMAVGSRTFPVYGLQFHPESVLTPQGDVIMRNFLSMEAQGL